MATKFTELNEPVINWEPPEAHNKASQIERVVMPDGTTKLCYALYGRKETAKDYIGGSEAKMLHDAARLINTIQSGAVNAAAKLARLLHHDDITDALDHELYAVIKQLKELGREA